MLYVIKLIYCKNLIFWSGITFLLIFTFPGHIYGADTLKQSAYKLKTLANSHTKKNEAYEAIYYFTHYLKRKPDDTKSVYKLASLYFETRDYEKAKSWFDTVIARDEKKMELAYYYYGKVCMNLEEYDQAIESLTQFKKVFRVKKDQENLRRNATSLIESSEWAKAHLDTTADVTLHSIGNRVNGPHIEFSPFPIDESHLIYGSLIPDTTDNDKEIRQLYLAEKNNNRWELKGKLEGPINHPIYNTGNAAISQDGLRMYFTRCKPNWQNKEICELFVSEKKDGEWQEPEKLPYPVNDETYTTTQPAIGVNPRKGNDAIYFVSDREGTRGGLDIWYTEYNTRTKEYKIPRTLGRSINSYGDDCSPFIDPATGSMFFSSNGRNGFGGFDIYRAEGSGRSWTDGVALPKPLNSSYDDTYYSTPNGTEGFFTSNRPGTLTMHNGGCCDDIFYFKYNQCVTLPASGTVFNITNKDIYDHLNSKYNLSLEYIEDNTTLANIPVKLFLIDPDTKQELFLRQIRTDDNGNYRLNLERNKEYVIIIENYGYFDKRITVSGGEYNCDETIDLKETGINFLPEITVRFNIYYEHDKSRLTPEARATIDTMLLPLFDLYPTAMVEIGSHTDYTGTDNYNIKLSQRRSESVVNYLIENGIDEERLVAKGYGESQPIAPNENPDGSDNPEGRQLNRRTEFRIIGSLNSFYFNNDDDLKK